MTLPRTGVRETFLQVFRAGFSAVAAITLLVAGCDSGGSGVASNAAGDSGAYPDSPGGSDGNASVDVTHSGDAPDDTADAGCDPDQTSSDPANCGACGLSCAAGEKCCSGACRASCDSSFKFLVTDYGQAPWTGTDLKDALAYHGLGTASFGGKTTLSHSGQTIWPVGEWDWTYYGIHPGEMIGDGTIRDNLDCYGGDEHPGCYTSGPSSPAEGYSRLVSYLQHHTPAIPPGYILSSMPGSFWYQHYSGTLAANQIIGAENGAGTGNFQSHLAFTRGAARQFGWEWFMDWSSWYGTSVRATRASNAGGNNWCPTCGHSDSLMNRLFYLSWLGGANYIHDEGGALDYFQELPKNAAGILELTATGKVAKSFNDFVASHERGTPFVPIAVVLNRYHGIGREWSSGKTWEYLPWTTGDADWYTYVLFNNILWPSGFNDTLYSPSEDQDMVPTTSGWGDMIDVVTEDAAEAVLGQYDVLVLTGPIEFNESFIQKISSLLQAGRSVILSPSLQGQASSFAVGSGKLFVPGDIYLLGAHLKAAYEASSAPFVVSSTGNRVAYQIANLSDGARLLALYNHRGVVKAIHSTSAEYVDSNYTSTATVSRLGGYFGQVTKLLGTASPTSSSACISQTVQPGEVVILKIETADVPLPFTPPTFGGSYMTSNLGCNYDNPVSGSAACPPGYDASVVFGAMGANVCSGASDQAFLWVCTSSSPKTPARALGGWYQTSNAGCTRDNPKTGAASCPEGYADEIVYGVMGPNICTGANDQSWLHVCLKDTPDSASMVLGGLYRTSNLGCNDVNPATGCVSCPAGYTDSVVFGSAGANTCSGANDQSFLHLCWTNP